MLKKTLVARPPLDTIALDKMSRAENDYLHFMPFYTSESTEIITDDLVSVIKENLNRTSIAIWDPFVKNVSHFKHSHLPQKLKAMESIPMDTMMEKLHGLRPMTTDESWGLPNWYL